MESHNSSLGASPVAADSPTSQPHYRSAKTHPQIKIEPHCLVFPPPHFGRCIQNAISIYNVSKQPCVFKMRSQNPERYVAKPHVAVVAPESATRIFVTLRDMNTLGLKNLPEDTHDRFRISLKLYDPNTVDASLSPKELWSLLQERGTKVDHEQDLISHFTKKDTPVGGLVTFFPPTYIPVTSSSPHRAAAGADSEPQTPGSGSAAPDAKRGLGTDMDNAAAQKSQAAAQPAAARPSSAAAAKQTAGPAASAKGVGAAKPKSRVPTLWIGLAVAAMVVLSLAVVVGVVVHRNAAAEHERALRQAEAVRQQHEAERLQREEEAERVRAQHEAERLKREEEMEKVRAYHEELQRRSQEEARQQAEAARLHAEAEQARAQQEAEAIRQQHEAERVQREEEAERVRQEHEALQARAQQEAEEAQRRAQEEQARAQQQAEAERLQREEEAERARQHQEAMQAQVQQEAEEARLRYEAEQAQLQQEAEAARMEQQQQQQQQYEPEQ